MKIRPIPIEKCPQNRYIMIYFGAITNKYILIYIEDTDLEGYLALDFDDSQICNIPFDMVKQPIEKHRNGKKVKKPDLKVPCVGIGLTTKSEKPGCNNSTYKIIKCQNNDKFEIEIRPRALYEAKELVEAIIEQARDEELRRENDVDSHQSHEISLDDDGDDESSRKIGKQVPAKFPSLKMTKYFDIDFVRKI